MKELMRKIVEAEETVKIVGDLSSRYDLSLLLIEAKEKGILTDEGVDYLRHRYQLTSLVWCMAEIKMMELKEKKEEGD